MDSILLTLGMLLLACSGSYYRPDASLFPLLHIPSIPGVYLLCVVVGAGLVIHHQRQSASIKD